MNIRYIQQKPVAGVWYLEDRAAWGVRVHVDARPFVQGSVSF